MVPIARRNLLADKVKLLVAIGGVTLAIVLILVVQSLYYGVQKEADSFVHNLPGDLWIMQAGTTDLVFSNSFLPAASEDIAATDGVDRVYSLSGRLMTFIVDGKGVRTYVMALDPLTDPATSEGGAFVPATGTIILDRTFANQAGLSRGEELHFNDASLTVADVRHLGNVLVTQFAFVNPQDYRELFGVPDTVNFFLVSLESSASATAVAESLREKVEGAQVDPTDQFAKTSAAKSTGDFLPIIRVIMVIAFIVGLAVLSLTIYSATIEHAREYAVMKVIGASPLRLYRIVLSQSAFIAAFGFAAGVGLAFVFNSVAEDIVPQFITHIRWRDVAFVLAVTVLMSFVASYLPINRVARVDPASVFRA